MQNINIQLEDEFGKILEKSSINFVDILDKIDAKIIDDHYKWIGTIDPYGNTLFNYLQVPILKNELINILLSTVKDLNTKKLINELNLFLEKATMGKYVKFIGD